MTITHVSPATSMIANHHGNVSVGRSTDGVSASTIGSAAGTVAVGDVTPTSSSSIDTGGILAHSGAPGPDPDRYRG